MVLDVEVAWTLVDETSHWFTDADRVNVYSALGAGDSYSAIVHALDIAVQMRQPLPATLIADLSAWIEGYAGRGDERRLRQRIEACEIRIPANRSTYRPVPRRRRRDFRRPTS
jgi:hypothetical protein